MHVHKSIATRIEWQIRLKCHLFLHLPLPDKAECRSSGDAGPGGREAAHCGPGRKSELRRYYYEQWLHRRAPARSRARACERAGSLHGGAFGGTHAAGCGLCCGGGWGEIKEEEGGCLAGGRRIGLIQDDCSYTECQWLCCEGCQTNPGTQVKMILDRQSFDERAPQIFGKKGLSGSIHFI
jgi:hypothetical protein